MVPQQPPAFFGIIVRIFECCRAMLRYSRHFISCGGVVYHRGIMSENKAMCSAKERDTAVFGYEDFWATSYAQFGQQFDDLRELMRLEQEMVKAADQKATEAVEKLVCDFAR